MTHPLPTEADLMLCAYLDGELDAASALAFERRLAEDADLARARDRIVALRHRLREAISLERAPDTLRLALARIGSSQDSERDTAPTLVRSSGRDRLPAALRRRVAPEWRLALAACLVGLVAGSGLTILIEPPRPQAPAMAEVVADHLRAVMAPQPFDVASSDQHTVKPWFTGRLPFAPQVFDLSAEGFTLIGGRVDVLNGQPAAALAFRHGKHVISLISQPIGSVAASVETGPADRGFEVRQWTLGAMHYWAVSDVAAAELDAFETAVRAQVAPGE